MRPPRVSVLIPAYDSGRFLGEAVRSVLAQTYSPVEIVVISVPVLAADELATDPSPPSSQLDAATDVTASTPPARSQARIVRSASTRASGSRLARLWAARSRAFS